MTEVAATEPTLNYLVETKCSLTETGKKSLLTLLTFLVQGLSTLGWDPKVSESLGGLFQNIPISLVFDVCSFL